MWEQLVAGIMVLISIRELMPATFKYISAEVW